MPRPGRIFTGPEEHGKKDDDHRPARNAALLTSPWLWHQTISTPRIRRRRAFVAVLALIGLYLFFKNIPTNLQPVSKRYDIRVPGQTYSGAQLPRPGFAGPSPHHPPPRSETSSVENKHYYDGELRFYALAASLHGIAKTVGYRPVNKNVMFAAASLRSVSRLLPMACEMSRYNRNSVHLVLMGREDVPLEEIKAINGIGQGCAIYWHGETLQYPSVQGSDASQMLDPILDSGVQTIGWNRASSQPWVIFSSLCIHKFSSWMIRSSRKHTLSERYVRKPTRLASP